MPLELDILKAEAARSESQGVGAPDSEALFASNEGARSECEEDGASDKEVLFTSTEEAKPPNILAAGARYN